MLMIKQNQDIMNLESIYLLWSDRVNLVGMNFSQLVNANIDRINCSKFPINIKHYLVGFLIPYLSCACQYFLFSNLNSACNFFWRNFLQSNLKKIWNRPSNFQYEKYSDFVLQFSDIFSTNSETYRRRIFRFNLIYFIYILFSSLSCPPSLGFFSLRPLFWIEYITFSEMRTLVFDSVERFFFCTHVIRIYSERMKQWDDNNDNNNKKTCVFLSINNNESDRATKRIPSTENKIRQDIKQINKRIMTKKTVTRSIRHHIESMRYKSCERELCVVAIAVAEMKICFEWKKKKSQALNEKKKNIQYVCVCLDEQLRFFFRRYTKIKGSNEVEKWIAFVRCSIQVPKGGGNAIDSILSF